MNILELFAGSRSIGKAAEKSGMKVFSSDFIDFPDIDYVVDILEFDVDKVPFTPDVLWASPPCTGFSVAAMGHHWTGGKGAYIPSTDISRLGIEIVNKTLSIIDYFYQQNSDLIFFIENPRGVLRKMPFMNLPHMENYTRHTVSYCQYGDTRMKPTDIWTNSTQWIPRPICKNGAPCHESAPRGSKTGTQGLKNTFERSKIPDELCVDIVSSLV